MKEIVRKSGRPSDISDTYGIPAGTLTQMRSRGVGPKYFRVGRAIYYFYEDVEAWLCSKGVAIIDNACTERHLTEKERR